MAALRKPGQFYSRAQMSIGDARETLDCLSVLVLRVLYERVERVP